MERDWKRLARYVMNARAAMGHFSRAEFCRAVRERQDWPNVSLRHLGTLERGQGDKIGWSTLAKLEVIFADLGWRLGDCEAILKGGEPGGATLDDHAIPEPGQPWRSIVRDGIEVGDLVYRINSSHEFDPPTKRRLVAILLGEPVQLELPERHSA